MIFHVRISYVLLYNAAIGLGPIIKILYDYTKQKFTNSWYHLKFIIVFSYFLKKFNLLKKLKILIFLFKIILKNNLI